MFLLVLVVLEVLEVLPTLPAAENRRSLSTRGHIVKIHFLFRDDNTVNVNDLLKCKVGLVDHTFSQRGCDQLDIRRRKIDSGEQ